MTDLLEILKRYDALPPSAVVSSKAAAAILGVSERVIRYHPGLPRVQLTTQRYGFRKSDIEKLSSDGWHPIGDVAQQVCVDVRDHMRKMQRELNRQNKGE